jgi:hypothetical protein
VSPWHKRASRRSSPTSGRRPRARQGRAMRARALPPDAPARRHVRAVVLAIACTCLPFLLGVFSMCNKSMCVHGCMGVCMCVYVCVRMCSCVFPCHLPPPRLRSPLLPSPSLPSPLKDPPLSLPRLLPLSSPSFAWVLLSPPLPLPSLPFPCVLAPPLASHLLASPLLSPLPSLPVAGISAKCVPLQILGAM